MIRGILTGGAIAALAIAASAASAQPAPPTPPGVAAGTGPVAPVAPAPSRVHVMFGGDHVMMRNEVAEHVAKMFAKLDSNHDGFITKDEVEAAHAKMTAAADRAPGEEHRLAEHGIFMGDRNAMFDRLDTNHDGNISRQEFMAAKPQVRTEKVMIMRDGPEGADKAGAMSGHAMDMHMRHMGGMRMGGFAGPWFDMADANHDGRVSLAEAQAAALAHFDKADLNHDGKITPDERQQGRKIIRMEKREG